MSGGMPGGRGARSGVDMAIYDLVGKALGVPVHGLLGGAYRTEFEMLTNLYHKTPEAMAAACRECVEEGFKGLKVKVGDTVLAKGWNRDNLLSELAILRAALDVVPPDVYIDADANQGWRSAQWTVAVLMRFAGHDNLSIEQPLPLCRHRGRRLRARACRCAGHSRRIGLVAGGADEHRAAGRLRPHGAEAQPARRLLSCRAGDRHLRGGRHRRQRRHESLHHRRRHRGLPHRRRRAHALSGRLRGPCELPRHRRCRTPSAVASPSTALSARLPDAPGLGVDVDWEVLAAHQKAHAAEEPASMPGSENPASSKDGLRSILITGSGSGIGAAIARRLAGPGVGILVHALHNQAGCEAVAAELRNGPARRRP